MPWVERFKKTGCASGKDINYGKIKDLAKVVVPTMIVSQVNQKVAAAKAPFDVHLEVDDAADKCRLVIKKVPPSEIKIEWVDKSGPSPDQKKAVSKVKTELTSFGIANTGYLTKIAAEKEKVKGAKEAIKTLEGNVPTDPAAFQTRLAAIRKTLNDAIADGLTIRTAHNNWYLGGPRDGVNPILTKFGLKPADLDDAETQAFAKAVHEMSVKANEVKKVYEVDVKAAAEALLARLSNFESTVTKGAAAALADVITNLTKEIATIKAAVDKGINEMKLPKTEKLTADLAIANSDAAKRLAANRQFIQAEMESNKTRLGLIPKYLELVEKQANRLIKGVPAQFQMNPKIMQLTVQMGDLVQLNQTQLNDAATKIRACDQALTQFRNNLG